VCDECKGTEFGFERARAPLKYRGYTRVVERSAAPGMLGVLDSGARFDAVVPVPLHRAAQVPGLQPGGAPPARRRPRTRRARLGYTTSRAQDPDQVELSAAERRANVEGAFAVRERVRVRILVDDGVFTTGADDELVRGNLLRAGAYEVHPVSL